MRLTVILFAFIFSISAEELPLQPTQRSGMKDDTICAPLFIKTTFGGTSEIIFFAYKTSNGKIKGDGVNKIHVIVYVNEATKVPTYEKARVDGEETTIFRFSNQAEYKKYKVCLPDSTPEPKKTQ